MMASSNEFRIKIIGKGSHAALPHNGIDPVPVACQMVQAFQTIITRNKRPIDAAVISVTMIHTGEATNVVPDSAEIQGTVRTFTIEMLDMIERRMREIAEHTTAAFGARVEFEFRRNYPPTVNHSKEVAFLRGVMQDVVGPENTLHFEPTMGAEDFSYFLQAVPGSYFVIGNGDGMADIAMLLTGSTGTDAGRDERLVILAGTPAGGYRVLSVSADFCHPSKFYNLEVQRSTLLVEAVETADASRWGSTTRRFRYNARLQDLELIGEDTRSEDEQAGEAEHGSTNFLTGRHTSTTRIKGKTRTTTRQLTIAARPVLNGWDCGR